MRFLNRIYYDNSTLNIVFLFFGDTESTMTDDEKDEYVFSTIGNARETVSIIIFNEPNADVEAQLNSGMVPKIRVEETIFVDEEGNEVDKESIPVDEQGNPDGKYEEVVQYRLDFVPREPTETIPSYSDLAQETQELDMALMEMGVQIYE